MIRKQLKKGFTYVLIMCLSLSLTGCQKGDDKKVLSKNNSQVESSVANEDQVVAEREMTGATSKILDADTQEANQEEVGTVSENEKAPFSHRTIDLGISLTDISEYFDYESPSQVFSKIYFPIQLCLKESIEKTQDYFGDYNTLRWVIVDADTEEFKVIDAQDPFTLGEKRDAFNYETVFYVSPVAGKDGKLYAIRNHRWELYADCFE